MAKTVVVLCALFAALAYASCTCPSALTVDYTSDLIPDASKNAFTTIVLNENTWEVEFEVRDVLSLTNGHVIASAVNNRETAETAFTPAVSSWDASALWNSSECALGVLDTPATAFGIAASLNSSDCVRTYRMTFSLLNSAAQNSHCELNNVGDDIVVNCSLTLSSVRAYDATEPTAFLSSETTFKAEITLPRNLNSDVSAAMYATLAKCSVLNGPIFAIDCRVPGLWTFGPTFTATQSLPGWIAENTCVAEQAGTATFVRCGLNSVPVGTYTEVSANLSATVVTPPNGAANTGALSFSLEYTLPRQASATASASLASFIKSITALDAKYYYGGADTLTLLIETVDTSRLEITQLEMFNSASPTVQVYALRSNPQFLLTETSNSTFFIITFRPSAIRQDSAFYRNGPHGINITFLFTSARRQAQSQEQAGFITYDGMLLEDPDVAGTPLFGAAATNAQGAAATSAASASSQTVLIAVVAAATVLVVALAAAGVIVRRRRQIPVSASVAKLPVPDSEV